MSLLEFLASLAGLVALVLCGAALMSRANTGFKDQDAPECALDDLVRKHGEWQ